jgi:hypothetical protein
MIAKGGSLMAHLTSVPLFILSRNNWPEVVRNLPKWLDFYNFYPTIIVDSKSDAVTQSIIKQFDNNKTLIITHDQDDGYGLIWKERYRINSTFADVLPYKMISNFGNPQQYFDVNLAQLTVTKRLGIPYLFAATHHYFMVVNINISVENNIENRTEFDSNIVFGMKESLRLNPQTKCANFSVTRDGKNVTLARLYRAEDAIKLAEEELSFWENQR